MTHVLRAAVVGGGFWGSGWVDVVRSFTGVDLVALVDTDADSRARVGSAAKLSDDLLFASVGEMLETIRPDVAIVVVPPIAHAPVALECLEAGVDVMIEKPFAPSIEEAASVVSSAIRNGRRVMVTQSFRFRRGPRTIRDLIGRGAVGPVELLRGRFAKSPRHGGFREVMDEPFLNDMAIHHLDFIRGVFGVEPEKVHASSYNPTWSWYQGNAAATVQLLSRSTRVLYDGNWVSRAANETSWDGSWHVEGPEGSIHWHRGEITYRPADFGRTVYYPGAIDIGGGLMRVEMPTLKEEERSGALLEYRRAVLEDRETECSGADNLRSLALVLAAIESARTDEWVDLPPTTPDSVD